tara:strand:+ start:690 stop:1292 length:603 start_codon:yes stop_codon:yes gene_type:complete
LNSKNLLLIFTRNPELGKVKTRLAKDVGDKAALNIYKFLLDHTVAVTKNIASDKEVYYSEEIHNNDIWDPQVYTKKLQQGENLGDRMKNAFAEGFKNGYSKIAIIGSDLFDITSEEIAEAFDKLNEADFVVGPATDGGYYLLGMRCLKTSIFVDKQWGTSTVLQETLKDLSAESVSLLGEKNDVDHYSDIKDQEEFQKFF